MLAGAGLAGCATAIKGDFAPKKGPRVVVIGGGWGGATAAKYVRLIDPNIEVVLIEPNREFISCPFSNLVLAGVRTIGSLTMGYDGLRKHGVRIIHETATAIEPDQKRVRLGEGYLAVRPAHRLARRGFPVRADRGARPEPGQGPARLEGGAADRAARPAAGRDARRRRVRAEHPARGLPVPARPLRAHLEVAWYLKTNKPRSKLIVLDANQNIISKAALFRTAWQAYPNIDYRGASRVVGVDPGARRCAPSSTRSATTWST